MNTRQCMLGAYRLMLQFYPPAFRQRFAPEMMELAEAAPPIEWPLIFRDTGVAIVRCWLEGSPSTAVSAEPDAYVPLGGSPVRSFGLGFVLSTVIIVSLAYVGYRWPPACPSAPPLLTHLATPPQATAHPAEPCQSVRGRNTQ
jgi:hypothetical protein